MPAAKTINAARKSGKEGALAAGMNNRAPRPMVKSPATMLRLKPIHSISLPDGTEKKKYAEKKLNWISMTSA